MLLVAQTSQVTSWISVFNSKNGDSSNNNKNYMIYF